MNSATLAGGQPAAPHVSVDEQLDRIRRGSADVIVEAELRQKIERSLRTGVGLKVKLGLDPTAPDLHLGHTVVLQKLRDFQELGHQVIIILGDFTGMIGDPTGRSETRKPLTWEDIRGNAETYRAQLGRILDMERARVEFNSTWLGPLGFEQVIREAAQLTVAQMLQREDFARRHAAGRPISLHEFLYPVAQGYDSVALRADVELGGTDQTFNLLIGRDLQRAHGQEAQVALTVPILEGLDGVQKMSKSLGNYVGITEPPEQMYGKLMSVSDRLMYRYFELVTRIPPSDIEQLRSLHPMEAKKRLARTVTSQYHGPAAAEAAAEAFAMVFQGRQTPDLVEEVSLKLPSEGDAHGAGGTRPLWWVLRQAGLAPSGAEARRLIAQGAVEVDRQRADGGGLELGPGAYLLRVGKRRFKRVMLKAGEDHVKTS